MGRRGAPASALRQATFGATRSPSCSASGRTGRSPGSTPLPSRKVRLGGSSTTTLVWSPPPPRSAASGTITAGDSASAAARALRACRRRLHAARRWRDATRPGGVRLGVAAGATPASADAPAPSRNQNMSVSSHNSPRCQLMESLRSRTSRRVLRGRRRSAPIRAEARARGREAEGPRMAGLPRRPSWARSEPAETDSTRSGQRPAHSPSLLPPTVFGPPPSRTASPSCAAGVLP